VLHSEELSDVYRRAGVVRVMECRRLGWAGCVAMMDICLLFNDAVSSC
jgi:hypothetical protein